MKRAMLYVISSAVVTAAGTGHVSATMPNGLTSAVVTHATLSIDEAAARGGMGDGGMGGGMAGGMGGGMAGGMGGMAGGMAGSGMAGGMAAGAAGGMKSVVSGKGANVKNTNLKNTNAKNANVKNTNVKNTNVKNTNVRNTNVTNTNVNVARPVQVWAPRPYYGMVIAGATLGTVIAATTVAVAPPPPAPNLCWFWADPSMTRGYWDYCAAP